MFLKKLSILGLTLGLISLSTSEASAQGGSCDEQTIRNAIQVVEEYPRARTSDDNNLAFRVYRLGITEYVVGRLVREFCIYSRSPLPAPKFKITIVFRPFFEPTLPQPTNPVVLTTEGRTLKTPWVQIVQNNKVFEVIYFFNEHQVIYDQAKMANPVLPNNNNLRPIDLAKFYGTYLNYVKNGLLREQNLRYLLWLFQYGDPDVNFIRNIPVSDILHQASPGYTILAAFLTNHFLSNSRSSEYTDVMSLPSEFNRNSYRLNGVIWDTRTSPSMTVR
jgi:hypothetical protein